MIEEFSKKRIPHEAGNRFESLLDAAAGGARVFGKDDWYVLEELRRLEREALGFDGILDTALSRGQPFPEEAMKQWNDDASGMIGKLDAKDVIGLKARLSGAKPQLSMPRPYLDESEFAKSHTDSGSE